MILTKKKSNKISGVATDGDIRRALLKGFTLEDSIKRCINKNFIYADLDTPREKNYKKT